MPGIKSAVQAGLKVVGVIAGSHWKNRLPEPLIKAGAFTIIESYKKINKLIN